MAIIDKIDKNEIIKRYVYDVVRRLPQKSRADIEKELTGNIYDMLEARAGEEYTEEDVRAVLLELGSPAKLAAGYAEGGRALISGDYYDKYIFVLKIVLSCVVFGMLLATALQAITTPAGDGSYTQGVANLAVEAIFDAVSGLLSGIAIAFAFVTFIFALLERARVRFETEPWSIDKLLPVPNQNNFIKKSDPISGIVFTAIVLLIFNLAPQFLGVIYLENNVEIIPMFNIDMLKRVLPIVNICFGMGIIREIFRVVEGRYTWRLAIFIVIVDIFSLCLLLPMLQNPLMWNEGLAGVLPELGIDFVSMSRIIFMFSFVFAYALDLGKALYYTIRYGDRADLGGNI